jgi:hypothetical protein
MHLVPRRRGGLQGNGGEQWQEEFHAFHSLIPIAGRQSKSPAAWINARIAVQNGCHARFSYRHHFTA